MLCKKGHINSIDYGPLSAEVQSSKFIVDFLIKYVMAYAEAVCAFITVSVTFLDKSSPQYIDAETAGHCEHKKPAAMMIIINFIFIVLTPL